MYLQDNIRRLKISFAIFVAIVAIGTVGYMILTNIGFIDALYMTVITIATVGYKEVAELDNAGKLFTIFLIIAGTGAVAFFASQIVEYAIEGEVRKIFTRKAMLKRIKKMKGHIIICGFGRMGRIIVEEIKGKIDFIIIEKNEKYSDYFDEMGYAYIIGDATKDQILKLANIDEAKSLISVVNTDSENVFIVLTARMIRNDITIYTRASDEESSKKMILAGANKVFSPYTIGGKSIANTLLKPHVSEFFDFTLNSDLHVDVLEVKVSSRMKFCGKAIQNSGIRDYGLIVLALKKSDGRLIYNPSALELIDEGDILILIGQVEDCKRFDEAFVSS